MTDRLNDLELEILDVLRMGPETAELLTEMVAPEGGTLTEDELRSALDRLSAQSLVRPLRGWAADAASSAERVEAYWWDHTDEGRALAESGPSAGL